MVADDEGDDLNESERRALHDALSTSWRSVEAGQLKPLSSVVEELWKRR